MNDPGGARPTAETELADDRGPIPSFPPLALDPETGRILPISEHEIAARRDATIRTLDALARVTDETDTEERWDEVFRGIDERRPERPLFKGIY
jgi:hypothetical protein